MEIKQQTFHGTGGDIAVVVHTPRIEREHLALLCPGYLDSKDYAHLTTLANALCERGYTVARFDPIGTWGSGGDISKYTNTQYLEDIKTIINALLKEKGYMHILLAGHSLGAALSLLYAAQDPRITEVVAIMPPSGSVDRERREAWKETGIRVSRRDVPGEESEEREYRVPYFHAEDRDQYSVVKEVEKIHVPILFLAGERDTVVSAEDVRNLYGHANEARSFVLLKGIGHDYRFHVAEIEAVNSEIMGWLQKQKSA